MRKTGNKEKILRRYTNLAATIHLLQEQKLTLLDPGSWDDKNDTYFLEKYKSRTQAKSLLALCFSLASETYHHWKVFADGKDGVCIEFDKKKLHDYLKIYKKSLESGVKFMHGKIVYEKLSDVQSEKFRIKEKKLPFLKRWPYRDENEYRVVFVHMKKEMNSHSICIPPGSIRRITLSPWLPEPLSSRVIETLKNITTCTEIKICQSTLVNNEAWQQESRKVFIR